MKNRPKFRIEFRAPFSLWMRPVESNWVTIENDTMIIRSTVKSPDGKPVVVDRYVRLRRIARVVSRALLIPRDPLGEDQEDEEDDDEEVDEPEEFPEKPARMTPANAKPTPEGMYR
jgi:hypothetical protein